MSELTIKVFINSEIALFIEFKTNILQYARFNDKLCFLTIDELHLINN